MSWRIKINKKIAKKLSKLDSNQRQKIFEKLDFVVSLEDPRYDGKPLKGNLKGLWRYRSGKYRIVCKIKDNAKTSLGQQYKLARV